MVGDDRFCAFDVAGHDVLLLFRKGGTPEPVRTPGGVIPAHDGEGRLHLAFAVGREELDGWEARLRDQGIEIESRVDWKRAGERLLPGSGRPPAELATPGLWANYSTCPPLHGSRAHITIRTSPRSPHRAHLSRSSHHQASALPEADPHRPRPLRVAAHDHLVPILEKRPRARRWAA